jgi:hypothetical protein
MIYGNTLIRELEEQGGIRAICAVESLPVESNVFDDSPLPYSAYSTIESLFATAYFLVFPSG